MLMAGMGNPQGESRLSSALGTKEAMVRACPLDIPQPWALSWGSRWSLPLAGGLPWAVEHAGLPGALGRSLSLHPG